MRRSLPSSFSLAVGTLWVALKDKVCVATAGSDNQTWRAQTGPWVGTERPDRIVLQAFGCMFSSSCSRLLHFFFSFSQFFSHSINTLSFLTPPSLLCLLFHVRMESRCGVVDVRVSNVEPLSYLPAGSLLFCDDRFELQGLDLLQDCIPKFPLFLYCVCVCVCVCQMVRLDVGNDIPASVV